MVSLRNLHPLSMIHRCGEIVVWNRSIPAVKRKYGYLCQEIHARNGDRDVEQLEAKVNILELMDQMVAYRTKVGFEIDTTELFMLMALSAVNWSQKAEDRFCFRWFDRIVFKPFFSILDQLHHNATMLPMKTLTPSWSKIISIKLPQNLYQS